MHYEQQSIQENVSPTAHSPMLQPEFSSSIFCSVVISCCSCTPKPLKLFCDHVFAPANLIRFLGALGQKQINYRKYDERALSSKELMLLPLATLAGSKCRNPLKPKTCNSLEFLNFQLKSGQA